MNTPAQFAVISFTTFRKVEFKYFSHNVLWKNLSCDGGHLGSIWNLKTVFVEDLVYINFTNSQMIWTCIVSEENS